MNLRISEPVSMKIFKGEVSPKLIDTRIVSNSKQAMYFIASYGGDESGAYGEITINGKTYIVGENDVEAAF